MFKKLNLYYLIVSLPFMLLLVGSAIFSDAIINTITRNPHPQINYAIFCIILFGGTLIILSVRKLMTEAMATVEFSEALHTYADRPTLQKMANSYTGDVSYVLQMVAASSGRFISHQEQVSIDHELSSVRNALYRRNALPQYLTGLLVGMGLLGTFVGLLATLGDISILINSFAEIDMGSASPLIVFRTMIERMKAPMQSMGIAFSASMFGLLGSIILGLMMVGLRRFQGDILSLLSSEVARHIENALAYEIDNASSAGTKQEGGAVFSGEEAKILIRIEERLAESVRQQQRTVSAEVEEFRRQRADMLRVMEEQTAASISLRAEFQQMGSLFSRIISALEKGNNEVTAQLSELVVQTASGARESQRLQKSQIEEQQSLRDTLGAFNLDERLAEISKSQQRTVASAMDDIRAQRDEVIKMFADHGDATKSLGTEVRQLGRVLEEMDSAAGRVEGQLSAQIAELSVGLAVDSKETHRLLSMQVNEQVRQREILGLVASSKGQ